MDHGNLTGRSACRRAVRRFRQLDHRAQPAKLGIQRRAEFGHDTSVYARCEEGGRALPKSRSVVGKGRPLRPATPAASRTIARWSREVTGGHGRSREVTGGHGGHEGSGEGRRGEGERGEGTQGNGEGGGEGGSEAS